jgi:hypothetical protein
MPEEFAVVWRCTMATARQRIRFRAASRSFLLHGLNLIARPRKAIRAFLDDPNRMTYGLAGIVLLVAIYTLGIALALVREPTTRPASPPLLNISLERYYLYELLFLFPVAVASVIVHAGVVRLVCHCRSGTGKFEDMFAILGFGYTLIALVMGVPDLLLGLLGVSVTIIWPHVILGTLWYGAFSLLAVRESEQVTWGTACLSGMLGLLANAAVQFTFIR